MARARNNIDVTVASRRSPEELAPQARDIGPTVTAKSLQEALKADIIFLSVLFEQHPEVAKALPSWKGKTIIDTTNAFGVAPEDLDGLPSSAFLTKAFDDAKLVKGFNHLGATKLATDPILEGGHRDVVNAARSTLVIGLSLPHDCLRQIARKFTPYSDSSYSQHSMANGASRCCVANRWSNAASHSAAGFRRLAKEYERLETPLKRLHSIAFAILMTTTLINIALTST